MSVKPVGLVFDKEHHAILLWLLGTHQLNHRNGAGAPAPTWAALSGKRVTRQQLEAHIAAGLVATWEGGRSATHGTQSAQGEAGAVWLPQSRFGLTPSGRRHLEGVLDMYNAELEQKIGGGEQGQTSLVDWIRPSWWEEDRQLWFGFVLVKQFSRYAPSQSLVLDAFQRLGWPGRIDDPLPEDPYEDPHERLNRTVKNLNRGLSRPVIRFAVRAGGRRICWKLMLRKTLK